MGQNKIIPFHVIFYNINTNKFEPYDIMNYLINCYKSIKNSESKPKTTDEFKDFIVKNSQYMYWARCQYEIVLKDWPCGIKEKKIDIYWQIMQNIDIITHVLMLNLKLININYT
jgi:hypothetical protein